MNDRKGIRLINQNIGEILTYMGQYRRAEEAFARAIETAEDLKDEKALGTALGKRGIMFFFRGYLQKAANSLNCALSHSIKARSWNNACEFAFFLARVHHERESAEEIREIVNTLEAIPRDQRSHFIPWHLPAVNLYIADLNGERDEVLRLSNEIAEDNPGTEGEAVARTVRMKYLEPSKKAEEIGRIRSVYSQLYEDNPVDYYRRMQEAFTED